MEYDGDISLFPGTYHGTVRGGEIEIKVKATERELVIEIGEKLDTLVYVGNHTWALNNEFISFRKEIDKIKTLHFDSGYGYYILEKVN
jgi:hypothetical protein